MSKSTDVHWGRLGDRNVPAKDLRSHLDHLNELREQMGGTLKPETPAPVDDAQLGLFDGVEP